MIAYVWMGALALFALGFYLMRTAGIDGWLTHAGGVALQALAVVIVIVAGIIH